MPVADAIAALEAVAKRAGDSAPQEVESTVQSHPQKGQVKNSEFPKE